MKKILFSIAVAATICSLLMIGSLLTGCSVLEPRILPESAFAPGEQAVAHGFTAHPQFEGELVIVVEGLAWRQCKNYVYTPVYVVKAGDLILAAQPYQLKKVTP